MKRKIRIMIFFILAGIAGFGLWQIVSDKLAAGEAEAAGGLIVTYQDQPLSGPVFDLHDTKPGDRTKRELKIKNDSKNKEDVYICGVRTDGDTEDPLLEDIYEIIISQNSTDIYGGTLGTKTLAEFFADTAPPGCMPLFQLSKNTQKTIVIEAVFPESAGNEYQKKFVVFDLIFGTGPIPQLKINEVYYQVDQDHGLDSPKDRGIVDCCGKDIKLLIKGNASGQVNQITVSQIQACTIIQNSTVDAGVIIYQNANTGGNTSSSNAGSTNIFTGSVANIINVIIRGGTNLATCGKKLTQNGEWVEIYNPTDAAVSMKNWKLKDNSGQTTTITDNISLAAHGFILISKDSSTWTFWNEPNTTPKVALGKQIGDGLDNDGDHLLLVSPQGFEVDQTAWGDDTAVWNPAVPLVAPSSSIERLTPGFDNDVINDWEEEFSPSPGN